MEKENRYTSIRTRKRAWYAWLFWIAWVVWLLFWIEVSFGSWKEMEYQAFYISFAIFIISLIIGLFIWLRGNYKQKDLIQNDNKL